MIFSHYSNSGISNSRQWLVNRQMTADTLGVAHTCKTFLVSHGFSFWKQTECRNTFCFFTSVKSSRGSKNQLGSSALLLLRSPPTLDYPQVETLERGIRIPTSFPPSAAYAAEVLALESALWGGEGKCAASLRVCAFLFVHSWPLGDDFIKGNSCPTVIHSFIHSLWKRNLKLIQVDIADKSHSFC